MLGPFHLAGSEMLPMGSTLARKGEDNVGEVMIVSGRILDTFGKPVCGAVLDVWHADSEGYYDIQLDSIGTDYRGKFVTGHDGAYSFRSVKMKYYPIPNDGRSSLALALPLALPLPLPLPQPRINLIVLYRTSRQAARAHEPPPLPTCSSTLLDMCSRVHAPHNTFISR